MHSADTSRTNHLLAGLPRKDYQRFLAGCKSAELKFSDILTEPGDHIRHVYFPTGGFISLIKPMGGHNDLEVGLIGNEGMLGTALLLGVNMSPLRAVVQGSGPALRMSGSLFRKELALSRPLEQRLKRYLYAMTSQLAQTAGCTRFHLLEARLARWLLMTQDRARTDEFHITHEFLASMLGVRRVGVTEAAGSLQQGKLIRYSRGNMEILDRKGLERAACQCYEADLGHYAVLMS